MFMKPRQTRAKTTETAPAPVVKKKIRGIATRMFTNEQVKEIRASNKRSIVLADEYMCDYQTILRLRKGITYKNVE